MKLTLRRYSWLLFFQFTLLIADLFLNTFTHLWLKKNLEYSIMAFVTQDVFIIVEYLFFTYTVHSTCVYEVGATHVILRNCKFFLLTIFTYFLLSVLQHVWIVYNVVQHIDGELHWSGHLIAVALLQRLVSVVYYYTYKRTALTISDPRYYEENLNWIAEQLSDK